MNIAVVVRQVPDLIEPLEIDAFGHGARPGRGIVHRQRVRRSRPGAGPAAEGGRRRHRHRRGPGLRRRRQHALRRGGQGGRPDRQDPAGATSPPPPRAAAALYAEAIKPLQADLVLVGVQAHDELDGVLSPLSGRRPGAALRGRDPRREGRLPSRARSRSARSSPARSWPR